MHLRTLILAASLAFVALFALINWDAFMAPTPLTLGFMEVRAPLGLVMLLTTGVVSALFLLYILFMQASVIVEARRTAKELKGHRELTDQAEASRFSELRAFLERELQRLEAQQAASTRELAARVEQSQSLLKTEIQASTGSLSACMGEVEDKLDRALQPPR